MSASMCYVWTIQSYFSDGTLPPPGTICEPDQPPFPMPDSRANLLSEDDARVLDSMRVIGDLMASSRNSPFYLDFSSHCKC